MNLFFLVFMIFGLFAVGFQGESFGQPALEPGESGAYIERDITDDLKEIGAAIVDGIKSFFKWLCFWCDD